MSNSELEMSVNVINKKVLLLKDELHKPSDTHTRILSLVPNPGTHIATSLWHHDARDITSFRPNTSLFTYHTHKVPFDPSNSPTDSVHVPLAPLKKQESGMGCGAGEQGAIKRQWPTLCFACAHKQVIRWLPACEREQKSIQMRSEHCEELANVMQPNKMLIPCGTVGCVSIVTHIWNNKQD